MHTARVSIGLLSGVAAIAGLFACSKDTPTPSAASPDGSAVAPSQDDDGGNVVADKGEGGAPPDRSVTGTWEKVAVSPPDGAPIEPLVSVFVRSPTDIYASEGSSNLGTGYYHYNGTSWTGVRYNGYATSLISLSSGELLGYGSEVNIKAKSGDDWEALPIPQVLFYNLWGTSLTNLYASTNNGNVRFDGKTWSPVAALGDESGSFVGSGEKDIWFSSPGKMLLTHFDGTKWTNGWSNLPDEVKSQSPLIGPYGAFATSADDIWAMGRAHTLIHYDGTAWKVVPGPDDEWGCDLTRGWASSKVNAWLVGKGGCVFHWDGKAWANVPSGVTEDLYSVHGSDPDHVWIAPYSTTTVLRLKPE